MGLFFISKGLFFIPGLLWHSATQCTTLRDIAAGEQTEPGVLIFPHFRKKALCIDAVKLGCKQ